MDFSRFKFKNIESIRTKILLITIVPILIASFAITIINLVYLDDEINVFLNSVIDNEENYFFQKLQDEIDHHKTIAVNLSEIYENEGDRLNKLDYADILKNFLKINENTFGVGLWLEPFEYSNKLKYFGPYIYRNGDKYTYTEKYEGEDYDYHSHKWYIDGKENESGYAWIGPYYDEFTNIQIVTLAVPIYVGEKFLGVASADYDLKKIKKIVEVGTGDIIEEIAIVDKSKNIIISSPFMDNYSSNILYDMEWKDNEKKIIAGGEKYIIHEKVLPNIDWKLIIITSQEKISESRKNIIFRAVIGTLIIVIITTFIIYLYTYKFSAKINEFENKISYLAKRDFTKKIIIDTKDEFGRISDHYNNVLGELEEYDIKLKISEEELKNANEELEAYSEELIATEEELRNHYELLLAKEEKLIESNNYNKAIIKAIPDIIFIFKKNGMFIDCQANDENLLIYKREEFIGKNVKDIFPPRISEKAIEKINDAIDTGELQEMEYQLEIFNEIQYFEIRMTRTEGGNVLGIVRDVTDDKRNLERIEYLSYRDQLTGLYNRRFFEEELNRLDTKRNLPLSIIMADVNGLKLVNDSFGHRTGDELLMKFSDILRKTCRSSEIISRIGGDEFVILLPNMTEEDTNNLIKRIVENSVNEKVNSIGISVSFGYAIKKNENENVIDILNQSENEMYKRKLFESPSMRGRTINAIIKTLNEKNLREELHSRRVSEYCEKIAMALKFEDSKIGEMKTVGLLHDIGKIAIREYLLNKPGKLTEEEYMEIQRHPEIGYRILSTVNDMAEMANYVLAHHERWDGKGYPRGLSKGEIPIEARIIAIADAYDAMTSYRSYKKEMTKEQAIDELMKNSGSQFDPDIVKVFIDKVLKL